MNDELQTIIEANDKAALDNFAEVRGIKLDRRKTFDKMLATLQQELAKDAIPDEEKPQNSEPAPVEENLQHTEPVVYPPIVAAESVAHLNESLTEGTLGVVIADLQTAAVETVDQVAELEVAEAPAEVQAPEIIPVEDPVEVPAAEPTPLPEPEPELNTAEIEALTQTWAESFARDLIIVTPTCEGMNLSVRLETRHGVAKGFAVVEAWTEAGVSAALEQIRQQIV